MDAETLAKQALVEHETLNHVIDALRITLDWQVPQRDMAAKISSVCFMAQSFQRHLERLMALEENGGYLQSARERQPHLWNRFAALRNEHEGFRETFGLLLPGLEHATSEDVTLFHSLCHELSDLLVRVDTHSKAETELLQEAFLLEVGGEA